jgi:hypothetical protein
MRLRNPQAPREGGAVLLEVILALVLFVAAAAVIGSALSSSADSIERLRLGVHADNLAASVVAELEMGNRSAAVPGPAPFEAPFTNWTWQIVPPAGDLPGAPFEIIVRHESGSPVRRLAQVIQLPGGSFSSTNSPTEPTDPTIPDPTEGTP